MKPLPLSIVPPSPAEPVVLSPARAALAGHLERIAQANKRASATRLPLDRAMAALADAKTRQQAALANLEAIRAEEDAALSRWVDDDVAGRPRPAPKPERRSASAAIAAANEEVVTLQNLVAKRQLAVDEANRGTAELAAYTDKALLAVLIEEAENAFQIREATRIEFIERDALCIGLQAGLAQKGRDLIAGGNQTAGTFWLQTGEHLTATYLTTKRPETSGGMVDIAIRKWEAFANQLLADPAVEFAP